MAELQPASHIFSPAPRSPRGEIVDLAANCVKIGKRYTNRASVTVSLGVAEWTPEHKNGQELVKIADEKLYQAKHSGRNRVCT